MSNNDLTFEKKFDLAKLSKKTPISALDFWKIIIYSRLKYGKN